MLPPTSDDTVRLLFAVKHYSFFFHSDSSRPMHSMLYNNLQHVNHPDSSSRITSEVRSPLVPSVSTGSSTNVKSEHITNAKSMEIQLQKPPMARKRRYLCGYRKVRPVNAVPVLSSLAREKVYVH